MWLLLRQCGVDVRGSHERILRGSEVEAGLRRTELHHPDSVLLSAVRLSSSQRVGTHADNPVSSLTPLLGPEGPRVRRTQEE